MGQEGEAPGPGGGPPARHDPADRPGDRIDEELLGDDVDAEEESEPDRPDPETGRPGDAVDRSLIDDEPDDDEPDDDEPWHPPTERELLGRLDVVDAADTARDLQVRAGEPFARAQERVLGTPLDVTGMGHDPMLSEDRERQQEIDEALIEGPGPDDALTGAPPLGPPVARGTRLRDLPDLRRPWPPRADGPPARTGPAGGAPRGEEGTAVARGTDVDTVRDAAVVTGVGGAVAIDDAEPLDVEPAGMTTVEPGDVGRFEGEEVPVGTLDRFEGVEIEPGELDRFEGMEIEPGELDRFEGTEVEPGELDRFEGVEVPFPEETPGVDPADEVILDAAPQQVVDPELIEEAEEPLVLTDDDFLSPEEVEGERLRQIQEELIRERPPLEERVEREPFWFVDQEPTTPAVEEPLSPAVEEPTRALDVETVGVRGEPTPAPGVFDTGEVADDLLDDDSTVGLEEELLDTGEAADDLLAADATVGLEEELLDTAGVAEAAPTAQAATTAQPATQALGERVIEETGPVTTPAHRPFGPHAPPIGFEFPQFDPEVPDDATTPLAFDEEIWETGIADPDELDFAIGPPPAVDDGADSVAEALGVTDPAAGDEFDDWFGDPPDTSDGWDEPADDWFGEGAEPWSAGSDPWGSTGDNWF